MSGPEDTDLPGAPDMDDLGPDLRGLLAAERARSMPDAARLRLRDRLDAATGGALSAPLGGGAGSGGGGQSLSSPGTGATAARAGGSGVRRLLFGLSTFAVGAVTGAAGHAVLSARPQPVALQLLEATPQPEVPPRAVSIPLDPTPVALAAAPDAEAPAPRAPRSTPVPAAEPPGALAAPAHDADLAAERAIIDTAHTAVARGDNAATLSALARHARQFPSGRMAEERESLYVQALVQAGRFPEARERAGRFARHFPGSLLRPAVDAALAAIP